MHETTTLTYNGWSNRETWLACLWLTNDGGNLLQDAIKSSPEVYNQADYLERSLRDQLDDEVGSASMWSDLLTTAFDRINWVEIVEQNA